jgi:energy coupling factor transporter S component ThiW
VPFFGSVADNRRFLYFKKGKSMMKQTNDKKLAVAGLFCAVAVAGSLLSFPFLGSKCAPVQHMVNILCAVLLGPWYGFAAAFAASLIRNLTGLGSLLAFPGSMIGALVCGLVYAKTKNILGTLIGEVFGTAVLGGLCAYPIAILFMGKSAAEVAFYAYIIPFLISTAVGAAISGVLIYSLKNANVLTSMRKALES